MQVKPIRRPRKAQSSSSLVGVLDMDSGDGEASGQMSFSDVVVKAHIDAIKQAQQAQAQAQQKHQARENEFSMKSETPCVTGPTVEKDGEKDHPAHLTADVNEVAQHYVVLKKMAANLDNELKMKEAELGRLKRFKKNTLARYRQQQLAGKIPIPVDVAEGADESTSSRGIVLSEEVNRTVEDTKKKIEIQQEAVDVCKKEVE